MTPKWYNSLRVQIVFVLTLALLPLGAIAIYQTARVADEAERKAELALLALTERAANSEELIIARAVGAASGLSAVAPEFVRSPELCAPDLGAFIAAEQYYSFVGLIPLDGVLTCTSDGQSYDISQSDGFNEGMANQERTIVVNRNGPASKESVFIIWEPYEIEGEFAGLVSLSIPHSELPQATDDLTDMGLAELITFSDDGEILTSRGDVESAQAELPANRAIVNLIGVSDLAFEDVNQNGERRTYTVVDIVGSPAAVLGSWKVEDGVMRRASEIIRPAVFPVLMWFASLAVAMLSIYTFVLRHIARLRRDMDNFATNRTIIADKPVERMPNEFASLNQNFISMTDDILRDEAKLEDSVREKNVLIKEIHHRVKNNLQLISSIMNMQIRAAQQDETRQVLSRLQDRILSLATIHRDLYQSQNAGRVNVGALVSEVVQKSLEVGVSNNDSVDVKTDIESVLLYPDQAVPLSLLTAEAVTNAIKYLGSAVGEKPWIKASLKQVDGDCILTLTNSLGEERHGESTGLGAQLINAFAIQLGGRIDTQQEATSYQMQVRFKAAEFSPETPDF